MRKLKDVRPIALLSFNQGVTVKHFVISSNKISRVSTVSARNISSTAMISQQPIKKQNKIFIFFQLFWIKIQGYSKPIIQMLYKFERIFLNIYVQNSMKIIMNYVKNGYILCIYKNFTLLYASTGTSVTSKKYFLLPAGYNQLLEIGYQNS